MVTYRLFAQPMLAQRTDVLCYECQSWFAYFVDKSPSKCGKCQRKLPDLEGILDDKGVRKDYHFGIN